MKIKILIFTIIISIYQSNLIKAQNSYIKEGSIGQKNEQTTTSLRNPTEFLPIENWVGVKFIFLPKSKSLRSYGYQSFKGGFFGSHPSYTEFVGRIGTIVKVSNNFSDRITIKMDDDGQTYTGYGMDSVSEIAPIADIEYARTKWKDKTLWYVNDEIVTYNESIEKFGSVKIKKFSPVKISDVVAGWYNHSPVRFILQTQSGEEGYIDINLSGTNVSTSLRDFSRFEDYFLTEDPRLKNKWPLKIWAAIEGGKVFVGMTSEQARMSWGKPKEINKTITGTVKHEQWVYGTSSYLYFDNGILTSIQN